MVVRDSACVSFEIRKRFAVLGRDAKSKSEERQNLMLRGHLWVEWGRRNGVRGRLTKPLVPYKGSLLLYWLESCRIGPPEQVLCVMVDL